MVLHPEKQAEAEAVFRKWDLDFAVVGKTTDDLRFRIFRHGDLMGDLPIKELGDEAPEYDRPFVETARPVDIAPDSVPAPNDLSAALLQLIGSPDLCSRRWVWEQYDHLVQGNTVVRPGSDAAIVRVKDSNKGLAFSVDVTPRYCTADPKEGGKQAVAECWRNLSASGAEPLAATDNLNFGNPEKPEIMGQFVGCIKGIGEACEALAFPIVSGNVSLYNETNGQAIMPTPAIGGVGLIPDLGKIATSAFKGEGEAVYVIGETLGHLGQSIYLRDVAGRRDGPAPHVDLGAEKRHGDFVRSLIRAARVTAVHDVSDGGLLIALAEMAMAGGIGAKVTADGTLALHAWAFGEDQARYIVTVPEAGAADFEKDAEKAGIPVTRLGQTGGNELTVAGEPPISLEKLREAHEGWFPAYMAAPDTNA